MCKIGNTVRRDCIHNEVLKQRGITNQRERGEREGESGGGKRGESCGGGR